MFFFGFFWSLLYFILNTDVILSGLFPPEHIKLPNTWGIPLLNTLILLLSGATITWSHNALLLGFSKEALDALWWTVLWAIYFTILQGFEYKEASFNISDGIYGSTFFMAIGFHGFHVIIGTTFLLVCYYRIYNYHFTKEHHFGFEAAAWYWHFVDVVWLFLYISIFWWGTL